MTMIKMNPKILGMAAKKSAIAPASEVIIASLELVTVVVIGGLLARAASSLVRGATAEAGFDNPDRLAKVASVAIWAFAIVVAVNQIGIAATLVNTLFMGVIGALSLGAALAFGLGGRETAGEIVRKWYAQFDNATPKIGTATRIASSNAKKVTSDTDLE